MHPGTRPPGGGGEDGRTGTPEASPARHLPTLSGRVPAVSTSTQRWAGAGEAATSFPSTWTTLWPPEQGGMASWPGSNQNTCLRVSRGAGGGQQPCQSERPTPAGGSWGVGGSHQLLPLGAVLSPARPPVLHPPGCRERPGGGRHAPKGCRTLTSESTLTCLHQTPWN